MPSVKGITCSLRILGQEQPAQECGATIEDGFASAYVVAEANQRFHVNVVATEFVHEALEIFVYIDGKFQNSSIWTELKPNSNLDETYHGKREIDGDDDNIAFERPWKFDDLVIIDEKNDDCEEETSNIGMIEVVVLRCNELPRKKKGRRRPEHTGSSSRELDDPTIKPHPHSKPYWKNWAIEEERVIDPLDPKAVYEKDIKGQNLTHRVATEDEEIVRSVVIDADILFLDSFEKPYCILVMHYRSRKVLQDLDHIPRSLASSRASSRVSSRASSRASSPALDLDELRALSKEEMLKELIRYKKIAETSAKRIKSEDPENNGERLSKRSKVKKGAFPSANDEVVDLTSD